MTQEEIKLLQKAQLWLMSKVHEICVENNIRYYVIGGTALGAKRHGGFIPWDIDIDIAMPREDYERFKALGLKGFDSRFTYHDYSNTKNMFAPHAVICIEGTYLKGKMNTISKNDIKEVFIDVFPLDTAPTDEKLQQKQAKGMLNSRAFKAKKMGIIFRGSKLERVVKRIIAICMTPVSYKQIGKAREKIMRRHQNCNSGLVCSMASQYAYKKQLMPFEIYGKPTPVKFEEYEFFAPERLEEYLTRLFGDYMVLPDEKSRTELMNWFVELDIPEEIQKEMI